MTGTLHIVLAMKPAVGSFIENAKKQGVAGINIDGTRIAGPKGDGVWGTSNKTVNRDRKFNASPEMGEYRSEAHTGGRWPANIVLGHLEGCQRIGTKKVKGITGGTGNHDGSVYGARTNQGEPVKDYADEDGKETVEAWECQDGCPVQAMDQQSGVTRSGVRAATGKPLFPVDGKPMNWNPNDVRDTTVRGHADEGGASRFFKVVRE